MDPLWKSTQNPSLPKHGKNGKIHILKAWNVSVVNGLCTEEEMVGLFCYYF